MDYKLHIAGIRGTRPVCGVDYQEYGGDTSCYAIICGTYALVLDCGTGVSRLKEYLHKCTKVDIILTHLHYDHVIGLLDFDICTPNIKPNLYGTFSKWGEDGERGTFAGNNRYWPAAIPYVGPYDMKRKQVYTFGDGNVELKVILFKSNHPNETSIIQVEVQGKKILLMSDYEHGVEFDSDIKEEYELLIYDGMYTDEEYKICKGYGHSTISEGIKLAKEWNVKHLGITHVNPNKTDAMLAKMDRELQEELPNGCILKAGMIFDL